MRIKFDRVTLVPGSLIVAIFVFLVHDGLRGFFAPDEMMNLIQAWTWSIDRILQSDRPAGMLLYRVLFDSFGLNALPYRIVCLLLLLINLGLLYSFCAQISRSREIGFMACMLGAYHAHLADLYYTSSAVFDLLCFLFSYVTIVYFLKIRSSGSRMTGLQTVLLVVLFGLALLSKEMAVTLPLLLAVCDWTLPRPKLLSKTPPRGPVPLHFWALLAAIAVGYAAYKVWGPNRMMANPVYAMQWSTGFVMESWRHYLDQLFYLKFRFETSTVIALLTSMLMLGLVLRLRILLGAWAFIIVSSIPFLLIAHRGFFVTYMTLPAWYLYGATLLVTIRQALAKKHFANRRLAETASIVFYVVIAAFLIRLHLLQKPIANAHVVGEYQEIRRILQGLERSYPVLPRSAKILFRDDPFNPDDYILYSIFALRYKDPEIRVERVRKDPQLAPHSAVRYAHVFVLDHSGLREVFD